MNWMDYGAGRLLRRGRVVLLKVYIQSCYTNSILWTSFSGPSKVINLRFGSADPLITWKFNTSPSTQ